MKRLLSLFLVLSVCFCTVGCTDSVNEEDGYSFVDDLGRNVCVSSTESVAALLGSFADMWILAGGDICATADDAWEDFCLPLSDDVINLGSTHRPNREELIAANPTFVLASAKLAKHLEMEETLNGMGVPVAYFDVGNFSDYLRVLKIMTEITERPEYFAEYGEGQKSQIETILNDHKDEKKQTILVMRASAASIRAKNSQDSVLSCMLSDFGCINIADSDSMILDNLSIESIILQDPDKIFFIETGSDSENIRNSVEAMFKENPLWYELTAVKNGQVYYMDKELYNLKPNSRYAEAYENLRKILYEN